MKSESHCCGFILVMLICLLDSCPMKERWIMKENGGLFDNFRGHLVSQVKRDMEVMLPVPVTLQIWIGTPITLLWNLTINCKCNNIDCFLSKQFDAIVSRFYTSLKSKLYSKLY